MLKCLSWLMSDAWGQHGGSWLSHKPCTPAPKSVTSITPAQEGFILPSPKGELEQGCSSYPHASACSASFCLHRDSSGWKERVIMAGFCWVFCGCASWRWERQETMHFVSFTCAILIFKLLISVVNKVLRPLVSPAGGGNKSQDWYPKEPVSSMSSVGCSGENICPNGGHALAGFCYVASAGVLRQNIFRLEALSRRLWNLKIFFQWKPLGR